MSEEYNFEAHIETTATDIARMIVQKIADNKELMIIALYDKKSKEEQEKFDEACTDICIDILREIAKTDMPNGYISKAFEKAQAVLDSISQYVTGTIKRDIDEITSRHIGVKDPQFKKYRADMATVGDVMLRLEEIRASQGGNIYDYYNDSKEKTAIEESLSTETAVKEDETPIEEVEQ